MELNKKNYQVSVLMKSEVRVINEKYTAGCERVFLLDTKFLINQNLLTNSYTACQTLTLNSITTNKVKKLWYPHFFLNKVEEIANTKKSIVQKLAVIIYFISFFLSDLIYTLQFLVKEIKTDIYYVFEQPLVAIFSPQKTFISYHNFENSYRYSYGLRLLFFVHTILKRKHKLNFIFVSKNLEQQFLQLFSKYNNLFTTHILYNGIDRNHFKYFKKKFNQRIKFIYPSVWIKEKGIALLPKIITNINKEYPNKTEFLICGSPDLWSLPPSILKQSNSISEKINALSKKYSNVILKKSPYQEMPENYLTAHFTLFPSAWREPFSLSVVESLSCGTPVIAFSIGGTAEIIKSEENGYLVKELNIKSFVDKVKDIIDNFDEKKYEKISESASESTSELTKEIRNKKLLQIIGIKK